MIGLSSPTHWKVIEVIPGTSRGGAGVKYSGMPPREKSNSCPSLCSSLVVYLGNSASIQYTKGCSNDIFKSSQSLNNVKSLGKFSRGKTGYT